VTSVEGKQVVVTGKIPGESRVTAQAKLRARGALVADAVTAQTELLVTGASVGPKKIAKAKERGIAIVPWEELDFIGGTSAGEAAPVEVLGRVRQIAPMLASKSDELPTGLDWSFEIKWDGIRCVATVQDGKVAMRSRSDKTDLGERYPHIAAELATLPDCVLDGECVVLDAQGASSFAALVGGNGSASSVRFIAFDLLEREGEDYRPYALTARRRALDSVLGEVGMHVGASPVSDNGDELYAYAVANGLEGIVSKRNTSTYQEGARGSNWLKHKIRVGQEFVVIGYKPGEGRRAGGVGALLLAVNDEMGLRYCGKVGTGFNDAELARLTALLDPLRIPESSPKVHSVHKNDAKDAIWTAPTMVVQVTFQRWTEDGCLWHPVYEGQRTDKDPAAVVREYAVSL
jgi:bifunctional non-homologous end joining protein LigD